MAETLLEKERAAGSTIKIKLNKAKDGLVFSWVAPKKGSKMTAAAAKNDDSSNQPDERVIASTHKGSDSNRGKDATVEDPTSSTSSASNSSKS